MKPAWWPAKREERRSLFLAALIVVQALCAFYFIGDIIADLASGVVAERPHLIIEAIASAVLLTVVIFLMLELRRLLDRVGRMDVGLRAAQGQMADLIEEFFDTWRLTRAERDVAVLILKGLDNDDIARIRATAAGTVRAQTTSIYAKSGAGGRAQFVSLFMEELLAGEFSADPSA